MNGPSGSRKWYEINASGGSAADVWIYEEIGKDFWGDGLEAKDFVQELAALEADHITLHLNSPGGNVFEGHAVYNALVAHPARVTTQIEGLAASIASVIALAGERVVMADNALYMIHDPWGMSLGSAEEMRKMADVLDKVAETMVGVYAARSALSEDEIRAAMREETWYSASEAQLAGFVDEVDQRLKVAACAVDPRRLHFQRVPEALLARITSDDPGAGAAPGAEAGAASPVKTLRFHPGAMVPWERRSTR